MTRSSLDIAQVALGLRIAAASRTDCLISPERAILLILQETYLLRTKGTGVYTELMLHTDREWHHKYHS